jgi:hypothetical protein
MYISEKIVAAMTAWCVAAFVLAYLIGPLLETFTVLLLIGLIVVREILDIFTPSRLKERVDVFIFLGLLVFVLIVMRKVLTILNVM